ncbi:hypothetical protein Clacol_005418 [Clathrus columnatus]|uniref:WD40 repeat-like protein n=1 Tax=Clathrus columnatus TaxID=1419009 RepID=A0AAV5ADX0_9AGAM|nr:hypothetical protein Clacol_005418 [Clathrus columnatus]
MPKPLKAAGVKSQSFQKKKVRLIRSPPPTKIKKLPSSPPPRKKQEPDPKKKEKTKGKEQLEEEVKPASLPRTFKIIAGTYEKNLYGLEASLEEDTTTTSTTLPVHQLKLRTLFIFPAHVACVKTVAASPTGGKWLATGSADEIIKIWDLRRRKEVGGLMHHSGSITHLTFPSRSHLLSASEDGTLCLFHTRDWSVLRSLKGHKGRINNITVHPTGKVALSVGKDKILRMWDLMRGKGAASMKLGGEGEVVRWSVSGIRFAIQTGSTIDIYSIKMVLLYTITHPSRIHDIKFFHPHPTGVEYLLVAAEDKKVTIYELPIKDEDTTRQPKIVGELLGHQNRVKAVDTITIQIPPYVEKGEPHSKSYATTISSDGYIRIYDLDQFVEGVLSNITDERISLESVTHFDTTGSRLTCLTLADGELITTDPKAGVKRKREREEEEDEYLGFDEELVDEEEEEE